MLCEKCGIREAEVTLIDISRSGVKVYHLCKVCAEDVAVFPELMSNASATTEQQAPKIEATGGDEFISCPNCRTTLKDYLKSGRFGCPSCYFAFREKIKPLLIEAHGSDTYRGEPYYRDRKRFGIFEKLVSVKQNIDIAVAEENFELAAKLKREFEALKSQLTDENT